MALIFGGTSPEHEISCLTAGGVMRAIDTTRFDVFGVGIAKDGRWLQVPVADIKTWEVVGSALPSVDPKYPELALLRADTGGVLGVIDAGQLAELQPFDVAFILLHGPFGEDGTIQGLFEMLGIRYVGAGVAASAICMDKDLMKRSLTAVGLPVVDWVAFSKTEWLANRQGLEAGIAQLGYPVFVKPARGGSSVGISRVADLEQLVSAIELAQSHDPKVIVEKGLVGAREIEIAVLSGRGDAPARTTLPGEIILSDSESFYDYQTKYLAPQQATLVIPAELSQDISDGLRELAARSFTKLGVEGLARVDLLIAEDGQAYVNELNTMPGFTYISMFPSLWGHMGISYPELVTELIELATERPLGLR
ncbi:MAG: D-alanine--D-alanine ligase [Propionibacteriaceae bacterium]|nr:D-alanine--D-alanine ligase [Propionibacteriaceae bacterium]